MPSIQGQPQRSTFVTVLGWIFAILSGFGTFLGVLYNIVFRVVFLGPEFSEQMSEAIRQLPPNAPPMMAFMAGHFAQIMSVMLVVAVFVLISSIGLLRRWNWARWCFIVIMALGIVGSLAGMVLQFYWLPFMQAQMAAQIAEVKASAPPGALDGMPDMAAYMSSAATAGIVINVVFTLGFCVLYGWIIKKLLSAPIVAEFGAA